MRNNRHRGRAISARSAVRAGFECICATGAAEACESQSNFRFAVGCPPPPLADILIAVANLVHIQFQSIQRLACLVLASVVLLIATSAGAREPASTRTTMNDDKTPTPTAPDKPLIVAHYMSWYQTPRVSGSWGFWQVNRDN